MNGFFPAYTGAYGFLKISFFTATSYSVFDRERIYEAIWGYEGEGDSAVVAEHIRRIRAKLTAASCGERIETVWGVGYKWKK